MIGGRMISAPTLDLWHFPGPVRTPAPTQKLSSVGRGRCLIGPPSIAGQQHSINQADREEAKRSFAERSLLSFLSRKACREQRNPPPERRNSSFTWVLLSQRWESNQRIAGVCLRGVQALQSPTPAPVTGDASRAAVPRIRRGQGRGLHSFPRRCRWLGSLGKPRQAGPGKRAWYKQP